MERLYEERKIKKPVFQFFLNRIGIARPEFDGQARIVPAQLGEGLRQVMNQVRNAGADADVAGKVRIVVADFFFRLVDEGEDFFGSLTQVDPFFGQDRAAVRASEELFAQFCFEIGHLPRQRQLRDVQDVGSFGHIFFSGDSQEIMQRT